MTFKFLIADDLPNVAQTSFLDKFIYFTIAMLFTLIIENGIVSFIDDKETRVTADETFYGVYLIVWLIALVSFGYCYYWYSKRCHVGPQQEITGFDPERNSFKSYDLCIHMDLNKTIMAVDSVKNVPLEDVILLEHYKHDNAFLRWAYREKKGDDRELIDLAKIFDADPVAMENLESFSSNLQKTERELIDMAKIFDARYNGSAVKNILPGLDNNGVVKSFWKLLEWCKKQTDLKILLCLAGYSR